MDWILAMRFAFSSFAFLFWVLAYGGIKERHKENYAQFGIISLVMAIIFTSLLVGTFGDSQ